MKHFDWTEVEIMRKKVAEKHKSEMVVGSLFRDPVARALSHFNFIKTPTEKLKNPWAAELLAGKEMKDIFEDKSLMMEIRGVWQDGQASAHYLAGTHIGASWVMHDWDKKTELKSQIRDLEEETLDFDTVLEKATENLESLEFIGITEKFDESIKMLKYQFPNTHKAEGISEEHVNKRDYSRASEDVKEKLRYCNF